MLVKNPFKIIGILCLLLMLESCAGVDPAKVDTELPKTMPEIKVTTYTNSLRLLGLVTEIFDTPKVRIMMNPIGDETGASGATGAEIPRDITEMVKSALNSIGGRVTYVPYDPAFIQNNIVTGYSQFENKVIPDIVITGGITEFDRGLETRGQNTDVGAEAKVALPNAFLKGTVGFDYGSGGKQGLARITLDFNLLNFQTMTGIPLMNATNSMEVTKAISEKELGITLFGASFGRKGSIKKVQGRHDAVRLLVELSVIQMIGKYLELPYWILLDKDAKPDNIVVSSLKKRFYSMSEHEINRKVQEWLYLIGHDIPLDGTLNEATKKALSEVVPDFSKDAIAIDFSTFLTIYESVPVKEETIARRTSLKKRFVNSGNSIGAAQINDIVGTSPPSYAPQQPSNTPVMSKEQNSGRGGGGEPVKAVEHTRISSTNNNSGSNTNQNQRHSIGRLLDEEEW